MSTEPTVGSSDARRTRIWVRPYASLCLIVLLTYANQTALMPVLPLYVASLGGTELVAGGVIASFSIASFVLRPQVGWLVDDWSSGWILVLGCFLLAASTFGLLVPAILSIALVNAMRGVAWAALNTSANAILAELAPPQRRGEASGYFALFQALASTLGPPAALYWLATSGDFEPIFLVAGSVAIVAVLYSLRVHRHLPAAVPVAPPAIARRRDRWVARSSLRPSALLLVGILSQPAVFGFFPLYADTAGVTAAGVTWFYVVSGVAALLGRSLLGRISDRFGRGPALAWGYTLMLAALLGLGSTSITAVLLIVAAFYSLGQGLVLPALTALAIDRADRSYLGTAMATYSAAFQIGIGAGGLAAGWLITAIGYRPTYLSMSLTPAVGLVLTLAWWRDVRRS